jgi:hypothetical protein
MPRSKPRHEDNGAVLRKWPSCRSAPLLPPVRRLVTRFRAWPHRRDCRSFVALKAAPDDCRAKNRPFVIGAESRSGLPRQMVFAVSPRRDLDLRRALATSPNLESQQDAFAYDQAEQRTAGNLKADPTGLGTRRRDCKPTALAGRSTSTVGGGSPSLSMPAQASANSRRRGM